MRDNEKENDKLKAGHITTGFSFNQNNSLFVI